MDVASVQMAASDGSDDMSEDRNRYSFASDDPSYRSGSAASESRPGSAGSNHFGDVTENLDEEEDEEEDNELDEEIENRLMGMLLKGMVLQTNTCQVCSTPLLQSMDMTRGFVNTPKDPVGGVPYCVSCVAHVATSRDEYDIIKESYPEFLDTDGLVLLQLPEGETIEEEKVEEEQPEPEVEEIEKKPSWEGKRVKELIEMIDMSYDKRRQIATKVLGVKMLQGYNLRETPCEDCSMPLMQMPDSHEITCVVCPVIRKKALKKLKAQDAERKKEEETNKVIDPEEEKRKIEDKYRKEAELERARLEEKYKREATEERHKIEMQRKLEEEKRLLEFELKKEEERRIAKRVQKKLEEEENMKRKETDKRLTELQIREEERKRVVEELKKEKEEQEKEDRLKAAEERAKQAEEQLREWHNRKEEEGRKAEEAMSQAKAAEEAKSKAEAMAQEALFEKERIAEQARMSLMSRHAESQRAEAEAKAAAAERTLLEAERRANAAAQRRRLAEERLEREARENEAKISRERARLAEEALLDEEKLQAAEYNMLSAQRQFGGSTTRVGLSRSGSGSSRDEDWDIEYDDDEADVPDDVSRSSRTITFEIPDNFDASDPNALSQLMAKATIASNNSVSRRSHAGGRSRSRSRSVNRQYDGYADVDQGSSFRRKMLPPKAISGLPRGRPQAGVPRPSYRSQSPRPMPEQRQAAPSPGRRGRSRTPVGRRVQPQAQEHQHPTMVTASDDDDASYLTEDDVSVATQTLQSIMMKIDECKAQLSQPVNMNDDDASVAASIAHQVEAADLIAKLASAAVAVKQLEEMQ